MNDLKILNKLISHGKGMFTTGQAVEAGFNRQQLTNYVKSGVLERVERGIYISP